LEYLLGPILLRLISAIKHCLVLISAIKHCLVLSTLDGQLAERDTSHLQLATGRDHQPTVISIRNEDKVIEGAKGRIAKVRAP
jgi:hypothetical protein